MSLFFPVTLNCPSCSQPVVFQACATLNADRRPDLREAIVADTFQKETCANCSTVFRLEPQMNLLDVGRGQWIAAFQSGKFETWTEKETEARETFANAYGENASADAQEIGAELKPRLVFGWLALREKLVAEDHQLNDVDLELVKISLLRGIEDPPIHPGTELRLTGIDPDTNELIFTSANSTDGKVIEELNIPRELYDEIAADHEGWQKLREELQKSIFIDYRRLLTTGAHAAA